MSTHEKSPQRTHMRDRRPDSKQRGTAVLAGGGENVCVSAALTAANSAWECVDSRVWDGSAIAMCVSAGSGMFWSVLINNSLGRREAGAGTEEKHWGWVKAGGRGCARGDGDPSLQLPERGASGWRLSFCRLTSLGAQSGCGSLCKPPDAHKHEKQERGTHCEEESVLPGLVVAPMEV